MNCTLKLARKKRIFFIIIPSVLNVFGIVNFAYAESNSAPKFNTSFLQGMGDVNLEQMLASERVQEGVYRVELFLNDQFMYTNNIRFLARDGDVVPCMKSEQIDALGVDFSNNDKAMFSDGAERCIDFSALEYAKWRYESNTQRVYFSVPQAMLKRAVDRNYVDPEFWENGVTAAFINYNAQTRYDTYKGSSGKASHSLLLSNGFNLGAWRLRNQSNFYASDGHGDFESQRTYVERDLTAWRSQFSAGEIYSRSEVFDAPALRGIQIKSDASMLPSDLRGYSPVVTGVADSNATVEIRQGDSLIYSTSVAPGPFEIRDIPTYGSNGDLEITVIEADGTRRVQTQGFGMLPVMVKEGVGRYQFSAGKLDNDYLSSNEQWYLSTDGAYGITSDMTLFGGIQGMKNYYAGNLGLGIGTSYGSLSLDITHSDSETQLGHKKGESYRFRFGRAFHDVGTTLALSGYRYATEDYRSLDDHIMEYSNDYNYPIDSRVRSNFSSSITQRLPSDWGSLNFSASKQDYWDSAETTTSLSASYGSSFGRLSYQLNVQRSESDNTNDTRVGLYASYPLSFGGQNHRVSVSNNGSYGDNRHVQRTSLGLSGSLDDGYSYSLNSATDYHGNDTFNASGFARNGAGHGGIGYSQGADYQSLNAQWNGSLVAHAGGINYGPQLSEGFILAEVPGVEGAGFVGSDAKTASNGFAILENSTPYRRNEVQIDTRTLPTDAEVVTGNAYLVPRKGSVGRVKLDARRVERIQFTLLDPQGKPYSFGTQLESEAGELLALADPNGRALANIEREATAFVIRDNTGSSCIVKRQDKQSAAQGRSYGQETLRCH